MGENNCQTNDVKFRLLKQESREIKELCNNHTGADIKTKSDLISKWSKTDDTWTEHK